MGKLVIYLADGKTLDVLLDRERITIGRRPDNDVCLPFPAVSGEHAQVVTILTDSFLEDLGSTNGTLVNGKPIAKHFLRDRDSIDIGRQRLTYHADDAAKPEALPPDMVLRQTKGTPERVAAVRPTPRPVVTVGTRTGPLRPEPLTADLEAALAAGDAASDASSRVAAAKRGNGEHGTRPPVPEASRASVPAATPTASGAPDSATAQPSPAAPRGPAVRVLSGASQGRIVRFSGPELSVGRVGVQVALVRKLDAGGYLLIPLEGRSPLRINGAAVAPEGSPLQPGDTFEVAGVRLELSAQP